MKKAFLFLSALTPFLIFAQSSWNVVIDDEDFNRSQITDNALFRDSIIIVSGDVNYAYYGNQQLFSYNLSGERLWSVPGFHELIYSCPDYIYTTGYAMIGDVAGNEQLLISKYDNNGNEVFSIGYPDIPHEGYTFYPRSIDIAEDGTILVSSADKVVKSNIEGTSIIEHEVELASEINGIYALNSTTYLISTDYKIFKTDSAFLVTDSLEFSNKITNMTIHNDTLYSISGSEIKIIDSDLNIINSNDYELPDFNKLYFYDDNLWLQTKLQDSIKLFLIEELEIIKEKSFPKLVNSPELIITDNNYVFSGNSFTNQIGLYNFHLDGSEPIDFELPDIELTDFNIYNISINYVHLHENDSLAVGYRFQSELTIKNNGNDTIHSFAIFADLVGGTEIERNIFYRKFSDKEVLPGEYITVNTEQIYQDGVDNNELCFTCLAPNSKLESEIENNTLCQTFVINKINKEAKNTIRAFPNPFTNHLFIENSEHKIKYVELINLNGKVLIKHTPTNETIRIETADLKPGVYILNIATKNSRKTDVLIKGR